jgi:hypothetical protein
MAGTWLNMRLADDLVATLARDPADTVVSECVLPGALARSAELCAPGAVLMPGLYHSALPVPPGCSRSSWPSKVSLTHSTSPPDPATRIVPRRLVATVGAS